jgi:hypothetical protein
MIAQEVMTFKAQKQGLSSTLQLNTTAGSTNLKRKESMSANDREALERSKDVAAGVPKDSSSSEYNSNRNSSSIAATAAGVPVAQNDIRQHMDVDALERELGGGI